MEIDRPIATAVILFVILLLIFFLVVPKYHQFQSMQQKIGEKQAEYDAKFAYYSEVNKIYEQLEARKDVVEKINGAIPSSTAFGPLVYFFQKIGIENGLIVRGLYLSKVSSASIGSDVKEIIFSLDLLGSYAALKSFLASLENSARFFETSNISFGSSATSAQTQASLAAGGAAPKTSVAPQILQIYPFKLEIKTYSY